MVVVIVVIGFLVVVVTVYMYNVYLYAGRHRCVFGVVVAACAIAVFCF